MELGSFDRGLDDEHIGIGFVEISIIFVTCQVFFVTGDNYRVLLTNLTNPNSNQQFPLMVE